MRRGEKLREPDAVVLRGDVLKEDVLRRDATTNFAVYGFYGVSVWVPGGSTLSDDILRGKLVKARVVVRFQAGELRANGIALWDTGEFPHYDVVHRAGESLDELVAAIVATPSTLLINPYFDPDGGPD